MSALTLVALAACSARGGTGEAPADDVPIKVDASSDSDPTDAPVADTGIDVAPDATPPDATPPDAVDEPSRDATTDDLGAPCARDSDCVGLSLCGPSGRCIPLACTPGRATCVSATRLQTCDARGASSTETECPAGCADGACARCAAPLVACGGRCVNAQADALNCGACGRACASELTCEGGACVVPCASPRSRCGAACVDPQSDASNCGACGRACPTSQVCMGGACAVVCTAPTSRCGSACVDLAADVANCGACGRACLASQRCVGGGCGDLCSTPQVFCGGACVDASADAANCGGCGRACAASQRCAAGACVAACAAPRLMCGAACVDATSDAANCGACGRACATGQICAASLCAAATVCSAPRTMCGAVCADTSTDTANCGACGRACATGQICAAGTCAALTADTFQIRGLSGTGCQVIDEGTLAGDDRGGIAVSNAQVFYTGDTSTVRASTADLSSLAAVGQQHDGLLSDLATGEVYVLLNAAGVEPVGFFSGTFVATQLGVLDSTTGVLTTRRVPLSTPITLQQGAGIFAGRGQAYLFGGASSTASTNTWYQVRLPSGAVTTLRTLATAPTHTSCESWAFWGVAEYFGGDAYAVFAESGSRVVRYRIRDGAVTAVFAPPTSFGLSDMCSLTVSPSAGRWYFHYEGSGFAGGASETLGYCPAATTSPVTSCASPAAMCGAFCTPLLSDSANCGRCGAICATGMVCSSGACTCPSGQLLCGGRCVTVTNDLSNCGACGVTCATGASCLSGVCTCPSGSRVCGSACVASQTDRANCGACGNACPGTVPCAAGACACPTGQTNCSNACVDTQFDATSCGACGVRCAAGLYCVSGVCGTMPPLYHGWTSPVAGCLTAGYNTTAATNQGGRYPFNLGDSSACRAWKLAATVCTTMPVAYSTTNENWSCPASGGFTDPAFGAYCAVTNQYSCSTCPGACNAGACNGGANTLRNCSGSEATQP